MFKVNKYRHQSNANDIVLLYLLLTLDIFDTFLYCFYYYFWTLYCRLSYWVPNHKAEWPFHHTGFCEITWQTKIIIPLLLRCIWPLNLVGWWLTLRGSKPERSSFKWRVTMSGELMFLESYGSCDVINTVTLLLWRHKTISHYDFW